MLNKTILHRNVLNKFNNLAVHAIVNEAFINALPVKKTDLKKSDLKGLTQYSYKVLESMNGGFNMLTNAICTEKNEDHKKLLNSICGVAMEASKEAADRIVKDADTTKPMDEIVDKATFTKEEYEKFSKNADSLDIPEISDIIKDKVITAIRDEKDAYEKEAALKDELVAAVKDDSAVESFMNTVLEKKDVRHHISLLSKLTDAAAEALQYTTEDLENLPLDTLTTFTLEGSLKIFNDKKDLSTCLESLALLSNTTEKDPVEVQENAVLLSTIMYTFLETLKTLSFYKIPYEKIIEFVNTHMDDAVNISEANANYVKKNIAEYCKEVGGNLCNMKSYDEVKAVAEKMDTIIEQLETADLHDEGVTADTVKDTKVAVNAKMVGLYDEMNKNRPLTIYEQKDKDYNAAQFSRVATLYKNNPAVNTIQLRVNQENVEGGVIPVVCRSANNEVVDTTNIEIKARPCFGSIMDLVKESFTNSKLASSTKTVTVYDEDKNGLLTVLK